MRLHEWQGEFQRAILGARGGGALPQEHCLRPTIGIDVYINAYRARLHEALRSNFPALHRLLGDSDFADLAHGFIEKQPPTTASIRWFGAQLPDYLRTTKPYCDLPILAELAQFEWALRHSVDAADVEHIGEHYLQALSAEQWSTLRCELHASLTILHFAWNAPQVWKALEAGEEPPSPKRSASYWFVYRDADLMSQWRSADALEAAAIQQWLKQKNFGDICEFLVDITGAAEQAIAMAGSFMRAWIQSGLLVYPLAGEESFLGERNVCNDPSLH